MRLLLLLGVITWHVTNSGAWRIDPEPSIVLRTMNEVRKSVDTFSNTFFKNVVENESGNFVCSPVSASMVLLMAAFGARGNTQRQLLSAFGVNGHSTLSRNGINSFVRNFENFTKVDLHLANEIFFAAGFQAKSEFMDVTRNTFGLAAQSLDSGNAIESADTINNWCKAQTNNRIERIISADQLNRDTSIVLVNAVYFKGNWASKFNASYTQLRPFYVNGSNVKDVSTMFISGGYNYGELYGLDAKFVELPYENNIYDNPMSMYIILPNERNGIAELKKKLDQVTLDELYQSKQHVQNVSIYLPKFQIESYIDLTNTLRKMGLTDMFTENANFTGIADYPPLKISASVQKAFIEVNEEGTEATAASALVLSFNMGVLDPPPEYVNFIVDRPFVAVITDREVPFFSAVITNPTYSGKSRSATAPVQDNSFQNRFGSTRKSVHTSVNHQIQHDLHQRLIFTNRK